MTVRLALLFVASIAFAQTAGPGIVITGQQIAVEDAVIPRYLVGEGSPLSKIKCTAGRDFYTDKKARVLYFCGADDVWISLAPPYMPVPVPPVSSVAGKTGEVVLGIPDIAGLQAALEAKQQAVGFTPEKPLTFTSPLTRAGDTVSCLNCGGGNSTAGVSSAAFLKTDMTTKGAWLGVYGADGYSIIGAADRPPQYVSVLPKGNSNYVWEGSTAEPRALRKPTAAGGIAAGWYSYSNFSIDVQFTDGKPHQVALYMLDWDRYLGGRTQKIEVLDAAGNVLDARAVSAFTGGQYLVWSMSGHVIIKVTNTGDPHNNAVVNAIFFN